MGFIGKSIKKTVKKLKDRYSAYRKRRNGSTFGDSDEHIYEDISVAPDSSAISVANKAPRDQIYSSTPTRQLKSSLSTPKDFSSNDSLDDPLTSSFLDSGISDPISPMKKVRRIQFTTASVHEYDRNSLEISDQSKNKKDNRVSGGIFRAKYIEVPSPQKVQIIDTSSTRNSETPNETHPIIEYIDPCDIIKTTTHYASPIGNKRPAKPPRSDQRLFKTNSVDNNLETPKRSGLDELENNEKYLKYYRITGTSATKYPYADLTSSSSLNTDDAEKMLSLSKKPRSSVPKTKSEPIYAQITPRSSRNLEQITPLKISSPISSANSTPQPKSETSSCSSKTSLIETADSRDFLPGATSSMYDVLSNETKESFNMIHKTNWDLKKDFMIKDHECHMETKSPLEVSLDKKFVINMFESRPSKRWEKTLRNLDIVSNDSFQKNAFIRMSLDSKVMENNLKIASKFYDEVEQNIEMLERESKLLQIESKEIVNELKQMRREDNNKNDEKTSHNLEQLETAGIEVDDMRVNNFENIEKYQRYKALKNARDIECARMAQASKALEQIKSKKGKKDWLEVLVAEKVLLETSERVKLLTEQITDNSYTTIPEPPLHKGTLRLAELKFPFAKCYQETYKPDKHFTEFFLMTVSHGTRMFVSEVTTGEEDPLSFKHEYTFADVAPDFQIKTKLFCIRLRTSDEFFWEKFMGSTCCPTSKIIYEDLLTHQYEEKTVFKTSFKLCAEAILTSTQINEPSTRIISASEIFEKLDGVVEHQFKCDDVDMTVSLSGFLDVGTLLGETYFWERKWCALRGPNLLIYNYPQEEDFGKPVEQINLQYCFGPIVTNIDNCPRRRCFQLKTGRPNDDSNHKSNTPTATLRSKPNFALRKLYFAARDKDEYARWTVEVEKLLDSLKYFKKLVFDEEYVDCVK